MMHETCAFARKHSRATLSALVLCLTIGCAVLVTAQLPVPASSQFDITGFIQAATVSGTDAHAGGTITVNNHQIVIPKETIVILPANALTWSELFLQAPAPWGPTQSGLADADSPKPLFTYEAHVIGNRVIDTAKGTDRYIAGLVFIAQQSLNSGAGFINFIDYTTGEFRVGGAIGSATSGTRVQLNDPSGRYGRAMTPDARFTVDPDNPTISSGTGFPMCIPRVTADPHVAGNPDDSLCPQANRTVVSNGPPIQYAGTVQMSDPTAGHSSPDPTLQAPFEVGDYVTYAGTLFRDTTGTYVSAHTVSNNIAIFTWPGTNPAYVFTEVALIGTGGLTVIGGGEAAIRTRFEGMSTDPSRNIHLYGIDLDPATGASTDRDWGTIGVDQGPPTGAVKGRWRFRPPCTGTVATDKVCTPPPAGTFLPPTREVRAVVEGLQSQVTALNSNDQTKTAANGLFYGQYHAPILEYIFPENIPGAPIVENNFNAIEFLARGGYTSSAGTRAGVLDPWPSNVVPAGGCTTAAANAGGPYTAPANGTVTLSGSATGSAPITYAWTASPAGTFSDATLANPVFTAPATGPVTLTLTVTNCGGSATSNATVTVNAPQAPTVSPIAPVTTNSGAVGVTLNVSGSDPNTPANTPLTFTATQSGTPALQNLTVTSTSGTTAQIKFNVPTLPTNQTTASVVTLNVVATNTANAASVPQPVNVTINPQADVVAVQSTEYRTSKQRLIINASSTVIDPGVLLKLQPYKTLNGTTYDPDPAKGGVGNTFTNNGGGLYIIDLVGAPEPAVPPATPIVVKSSLGGTSVPTGITKLRQ